jgi:metal-responsive CopG/Arc/MetJ family transcriptional regulator
MASPMQSFRLPDDLALKVDRWGKAHGIPTRGRAIRAILERWTDAAPAPAQTPARRGLVNGLLR